jgi:outer membrane protein assembly factor BamB
MVFSFFQFSKHLDQQRSPASGTAVKAWPTFRGGYLNQGLSSVSLRETKQVNPAISSFKTLGLIWGSAVIDEEDTVYVGSADKKLYAIDRTGKVLWTQSIYDKADAVIDSAAALTKTGKVVVPGGDGYLHILDKTDGHLIHTFKSHGVSDASQQQGGTVNSFEGNVQMGPNGWIYAGSDNGHMYAVNEDGTEQWDFPTKNMIWSSPAFSGSDNKWMAFGSLDKHFYLLDPSTGKMFDSFDASGEVKSSPAHDGEGNLYVGSSGNKFFSFKVVASDNGFRLKKRWEFPTHGEIYSSPALWKDNVVFGSLEGTLYCLNTSGHLVWKFPVHSPISSSPVISADGIVVFGAKNGTLYAVDVKTGLRAWSAKVTPALLKSNLDASPAITSTGEVFNGSYDNNIYRISSSYCASTKSPRCKFGGHEDMPDFEGKLPDDGASLRFIDREGAFHKTPPHPVGLAETLQLRLVAMEDGSLIDNAAIRATHTDINIEPYVDFDLYVSSDGTILNILPSPFFKPNTHYHIDIKGKYFKRGGWIGDRFAFFGLKEFSSSLDFTTKPASPEIQLAKNELVGIQSLYLSQPQALDTYIPAAMDGQGFLASTFGFNPENGHFVMLVLPGLPVHGGVPTPLAEPSKAFILNAETSNGGINSSGQMTLAAMGGEIPFKKAAFSADFSPDHGFANAGFFLVSQCTDIRGNGSSYSFAYSLINQLCDFELRMIGLGTFESKNIPVPSRPAGMNFHGISLNEKFATVTLSPPSDTQAHLISVVRYRPEEAMGILYGVVATDPKNPSKAISLPLKAAVEEAEIDSGDRIQVYFDQTPVANCSVDEVKNQSCRASSAQVVSAKKNEKTQALHKAGSSPAPKVLKREALEQTE